MDVNSALTLIIFSIILVGMAPLVYGELVEMKLEVYIFDVKEGIIKMCVDIYCHVYYDGSGSISKTFLVPPGEYSGVLEWSHTKPNCATDNNNVCAASGKVVVPNEKDGPLTIQVWNQYELGAQVFNNQKITFNVEIPSFDEPIIITPSSFTTTLEESLPMQNDSFIVLDTAGVDTGFEPIPEPEPTPEPEPNPAPEPSTDLEQRISNLENRVGVLEGVLQSILNALRAVFG